MFSGVKWPWAFPFSKSYFKEFAIFIINYNFSLKVLFYLILFKRQNSYLFSLKIKKTSSYEYNKLYLNKKVRF
jgi:hypothetical protein